MRKPIVVPDLGEVSPVLSVWYVNPGEWVYAGDRVVEVLIRGATVDIAAPVSGRLLERLAGPDESLSPGQVLGHVEEDEDAE